MAMEGLSIMPVEVLSMVSTQGRVDSMQGPIGSSRNTHLHESWQLAVTRLNTKDRWQFSNQDVQHIRKFKNLQRLTVKTAGSGAQARITMPGWQLVSRVAPGLRKLRSIIMSGPSSFEVLKVLQASEQLQQRMTHLALSDHRHVMTAADMYCLADMKALAELELDVGSLPEHSSEALAMASAALSTTLQTLRLAFKAPPAPATTAAFPGHCKSLSKGKPLKLFNAQHLYLQASQHVLS
jgi:hypothetical protein